jgi:cytochrome c peroxidase
MRLKTIILSLFLAAFAGFLSCSKTETTVVPIGLKPVLPDQTYNYNAIVNTFPGINIDPGFGFSFTFNTVNPTITNDGATLGRVLFYDPQLSASSLIACASCHKQELGFSDGKAFSTGFEGATTPRSSMAIVNPGFNRNLFWDSRSASVLDLVARPIQNHIEMGMEDLTRLEKKLGRVDYYPDLFRKAFGDASITKERIEVALSQFVSSIVTLNSRFDDQQKVGFTGFTDLEQLGKNLFESTRTNCSTCHAGVNFSAPDFPGGPYGSSFSNGNDLKGGANNGLDAHYSDNGMGNGRFRIPSLRNIALTAPYMHDGRFKTLEEVVEHYNSGIADNSNLDKNLRNPDGTLLRPNLNGLEKQALVAFMNTLTDKTMISDPKYSNPFK